MPENKTAVYVALLRGINVGGHRKVAMADCRRWFEELGYAQVRTYVQSGNVVLRCAQPAAKLAPEIEDKLEQCAGFPVRVIIRSARELHKVRQRNPFLARPGVDLSKLHVTFLAKKPLASARLSLAALAAKRDELEVAGANLFLYCPAGYGQSKLSNNMLERLTAAVATTRNWRTVNQLCALCQECG